ncbi:transglutaminase domain-containing protein [Oribacterium sp. WCC10]|uniref:transglutaminase domain-containing protein n=1 Tax=Oribacterium sp. WCC10 TaxID=1855343 RepID=UPI0008F3C104|nr:transglutaminase domain-containing protein [Oribacterium sp. WCC10]SFG73523.1 Transglutaminase-like superfamily protein [Oribacterium sp. WCC10]
MTDYLEVTLIIYEPGKEYLLMQNPNRNYDDYYSDYRPRKRRSSGGGCLSTVIVIALIIFGISFAKDALKPYYNDLINAAVDICEDYGFDTLLPDGIPGIIDKHTTETGADSSKESTEESRIPSSYDAANEKDRSESDVSADTDADKDSIKEGIDKFTGNNCDITDESQAGYYCYNLLNDDSKTLYREILDSLINWKKRNVSTVDSSELNTVYNYVIADHPEIFYTSGLNYTQHLVNGVTTGISIEGKYTMSHEDALSYESSLIPAIQNILATVPGYLDGKETDDFTKIKYIYDYIISNTDYVLGADENQNIISVLLNHRSVCNGYAKTFQYLSQLLGIPSVLVCGYADGGLHAWNVVLMDGAWYQMDVTFGEYQTTNGGNDSSIISYAYFGLTDTEMYANHSLYNTIPVPTCSAAADNYYVKTGTYFTSADISEIGELIRKAQSNGEHVFQLRTDTDETMQTIIDKLFSQQLIYNYLTNVRSCSYAPVPSQNTLIITF